MVGLPWYFCQKSMPCALFGSILSRRLSLWNFMMYADLFMPAYGIMGSFESVITGLVGIESMGMGIIFVESSIWLKGSCDN